jgi:hypothetical protein
MNLDEFGTPKSPWFVSFSCPDFAQPTPCHPLPQYAPRGFRPSHIRCVGVFPFHLRILGLCFRQAPVELLDLGSQFLRKGAAGFSWLAEVEKCRENMVKIW